MATASRASQATANAEPADATAPTGTSVPTHTHGFK